MVQTHDLTTAKDKEGDCRQNEGLLSSLSNSSNGLTFLRCDPICAGWRRLLAFLWVPGERNPWQCDKSTGENFISRIGSQSTLSYSIFIHVHLLRVMLGVRYRLCFLFMVMQRIMVN